MLDSKKLLERFETDKRAKRIFLQHSMRTQEYRSKKTLGVQGLYDLNATATKERIRDKPASLLNNKSRDDNSAEPQQQNQEQLPSADLTREETTFREIMKRQNISFKQDDLRLFKKQQAISKVIQMNKSKQSLTARNSADESHKKEKEPDEHQQHLGNTNNEMKNSKLNSSFRLKRNETSMSHRNPQQRALRDARDIVMVQDFKEKEQSIHKSSIPKNRSLSPIKFSTDAQSQAARKEADQAKEETQSPLPSSPLHPIHSNQSAETSRLKIKPIEVQSQTSRSQQKDFTKTFFGPSTSSQPVKGLQSILPFEGEVNFGFRKHSEAVLDHHQRDNHSLDLGTGDLVLPRTGSHPQIELKRLQLAALHGTDQLITVRDADRRDPIFTGKQASKVTFFLNKNHSTQTSKNTVGDLYQHLERRSHHSSINTSKHKAEENSKLLPTKHIVEDLSPNLIAQLCMNNDHSSLGKKFYQKIRSMKSSSFDSTPATASRVTICPLKLLEATINRQNNPRVRSRVMNKFLLLKNKE